MEYFIAVSDVIWLKRSLVLLYKYAAIILNMVTLVLLNVYNICHERFVNSLLSSWPSSPFAKQMVCSCTGTVCCDLLSLLRGSVVDCSLFFSSPISCKIRNHALTNCKIRILWCFVFGPSFGQWYLNVSITAFLLSRLERQLAGWLSWIVLIICICDLLPC